MIDIVDRLRFDSVRCETQFSKGVATNIDEAVCEIERLREVLEKIAAMDPKGIRADDLGRAARIAAEGIRGVVGSPKAGG
jgi:hypothetical protein